MINKTINFINQKLLLIIFAFCISVAVFSFYIVYSNRIIFADIDKNEGIKTENFSENNGNYNISINYPFTENEKINKKIKSYIGNYIDRVRSDTKFFISSGTKDKFNLKIDFVTERVNEDVASFIFFADYASDNNFKKHEIFIINCNLKNGKNVDLSNFFYKNSEIKKSLCIISKEYFQNIDNIDNKVRSYFLDDISYSAQNSFDGYSFSNNYISIYFNSNKISSSYEEIYEIKIPWDSVKNLLKHNIYYLY